MNPNLSNQWNKLIKFIKSSAAPSGFYVGRISKLLKQEVVYVKSAKSGLSLRVWILPFSQIFGRIRHQRLFYEKTFELEDVFRTSSVFATVLGEVMAVHLQLVVIVRVIVVSWIFNFYRGNSSEHFHR